MVKVRKLLQVIQLTEETMKSDEKYYTGLPSFAVLLLAVQFVSSNMTEKNCKKLTIFQLVIMKLRLNCDELNLAYV